MVYFNDLLAMVEAFRSGQVDILSHIKPYTTEMEATKGATVLTNDALTWATYSPNTVVSVLEKTLKDRPALVKAYLEGLVCAAAIINKTPEKAVDLLSKGSYFRVKPAVLLQAFKAAPAPVSVVPDLLASWFLHQIGDRTFGRIAFFRLVISTRTIDRALLYCFDAPHTKPRCAAC